MNFTERRGRIRVVVGEPPMAGNFVFMNAPRPLAGSYYLADPEKTAPYAREGQFVVAIDTYDAYAESYIKNNRQMDACCLVFIPKDKLRLIGLSHYVGLFRSEYQIDVMLKAFNTRPELLDFAKVLESALNDALKKQTLPGGDENDS